MCSWFLDNPDLGWVPAPSLLTFIAQARTEGKPLVYIGFGSITVPHARAMTRSIVKAVIKSEYSYGQRARSKSDDALSRRRPCYPFQRLVVTHGQGRWPRDGSTASNIYGVYTSFRATHAAHHVMCIRSTRRPMSESVTRSSAVHDLMSFAAGFSRRWTWPCTMAALGLLAPV